MQTQLPIFPTKTRLFNPHVGVFLQNDFVYYLHNGSPLLCHNVNDRKSYRYITANLVVTNLCSPSEIARIFGVSARSIQLNAKALREKGPGWFFNRVETRGACYKFIPSSFEDAQKMINEGKPNIEIAHQLGVSVSAIKYHIKNGKLKKK
jgi:DNA-binding CsgD family transcriptional regulator